MEATTTAPIPTQGEAAQPYPPSIHDRIMRRVQRLPLPYWLTYLLLFLLTVLIQHVLDWTDGSVAALHFAPLDCFFPLLIWGSLAIMTWLDNTARKALRSFGPLLDVHPETLHRLEYEFTTMPPRGLILRTIFGSALYAVFTLYVYFPVIVPRLHSSLATVVFTMALGFVGFNNGLFYHTIRQLSLVNRTVKLVKHFDLFRLEAVYAFSHFTARTGAALLLLASLILLVVPLQLTPVPLVIFEGVGIVSALAAFVLPLWVVHRRLVAEKGKLMAGHEQRLKTVLTQLHQALDQNELADMHGLHDALDGLNIEGSVLEKLRTWPWRNETLTGFLSIIVLPLALWFVQLVVQKWLHL